MKFLLAISPILNSFCFAQQSKDTLFLDKKWKQTTKDGASFFRVYEKKDDKYLIRDNFISGKIQMETSSLTLDPIMKQGKTTYYYENGYKKKVGYYENGKPVGHVIWYYENEKDSSVADYQSDGVKKYSHRRNRDKLFPPPSINFLIGDSAIVRRKDDIAPEPNVEKPFSKFYDTNLKYPQFSLDSYIGGIVFLNFVITKEGKLTKVAIAKGSRFSEFDAEALNLVNKMQDWIPGKRNNMAIDAVVNNFPILFRFIQPYFVFESDNNDKNYDDFIQKILKKEYKDALKLINLYIENHPTDWEAIYNRGVTFAIKGENKKAKRDFEEAAKNEFPYANRLVNYAEN